MKRSSWWLTVAAAGGAGIATWLYRRGEERQSEREHEAWTLRQRQLELDGRRLLEAWRAQQPRDWR